MKTVRVAYTGCGGIAHAHAERLAKVPEAEIVALCDPSDAAIGRLVERFPALAKTPRFADWGKMLDSVEADAVSIHTPHTQHFDQITTALERGLHVITEKPMVCTVEHARKLVALAEKTGLKLQVSYQWVFDNRFRHARELVKKGAIGKPLFVNAVLSQEWKRSQAGTWRQDPALSGGGQLNDSGSHLVNIVLWISGLVPESVTAFVDNRGTPVDINSAVSVRFAGGAQGTIAVLGDCEGWWDAWTIWGERGMLIYDEGVLTHVGPDNKRTSMKHEPETSDPDRNFVMAVLGREELEVPPERGLRVIQLTEAAWESAKTGKVAKAK